jgi:hypothetical protein
MSSGTASGWAGSQPDYVTNFADLGALLALV